MFMPKIEDFHATGTLAAILHAGTAPAAPGLLAGALVETRDGWTPVERLAPGDRIATMDGGFCPVLDIERHPVEGQSVIHLPGGALGACSAIDLMPGQDLFLASRVAEEVLGVGGVRLAAAALVGRFGIRRRTLAAPADRTVLRFAQEEIVYANSGLLLHAAPTGMSGAGFFERLDGAAAEAMLDLIEAEGQRVFALAA